MVAQKPVNDGAHDSNKAMRKSKDQDMIGNCLKCGVRLTRCGSVFSAEIKCPACGAQNIYRESKKPVELLLQ
jgi:predicted RNA-binding Zn-ribbon protein involved in translation (DUF1610 family)